MKAIIILSVMTLSVDCRIDNLQTKPCMQVSDSCGACIEVSWQKPVNCPYAVRCHKCKDGYKPSGKRTYYTAKMDASINMEDYCSWDYTFVIIIASVIFGMLCIVACCVMHRSIRKCGQDCCPRCSSVLECVCVPFVGTGRLCSECYGSRVECCKRLNTRSNAVCEIGGSKESKRIAQLENEIKQLKQSSRSPKLSRTSSSATDSGTETPLNLPMNSLDYKL